jgi:hypothetical protein
MSNVSSFIDNLPKCSNNNLSPSCSNKFMDINCPSMTRNEINNFCFHDTSCRVICPKDTTSIKNAVPNYNNSTSVESFKNYLDNSAINILGKSLVEKLTGSPNSQLTESLSSDSDYTQNPKPDPNVGQSASSSFSLILCIIISVFLFYMFKEFNVSGLGKGLGLGRGRNRWRGRSRGRSKGRGRGFSTDSSAPISPDNSPPIPDDSSSSSGRGSKRRGFSP